MRSGKNGSYDVLRFIAFRCIALFNTDLLGIGLLKLKFIGPVDSVFSEVAAMLESLNVAEFSVLSLALMSFFVSLELRSKTFRSAIVNMSVEVGALEGLRLFNMLVEPQTGLLEFAQLNTLLVDDTMLLLLTPIPGVDMGAKVNVDLMSPKTTLAAVYRSAIVG